MVSGFPEEPVRVLVLQGERTQRESIEADLRARGCEIIPLDTAMAALDGASRVGPGATAPAHGEPQAPEGEEPWAGLPYAKARELCAELPESPLHFAALWGSWRFSQSFRTKRDLAHSLSEVAERLGVV